MCLSTYELFIPNAKVRTGLTARCAHIHESVCVKPNEPCEESLSQECAALVRCTRGNHIQNWRAMMMCAVSGCLQICWHIYNLCIHMCVCVYMHTHTAACVYIYTCLITHLFLLTVEMEDDSNANY